MNNAEFWKDEILEITSRGHYIGLKNGCPVDCGPLECNICGFKPNRKTNLTCIYAMYQWLCAEHVEPQPKLTPKERMFCEVAEDGWIARDSGGFVYFYTEKPEKESDDIWCGGDCINLNLLPVEFNFVKNEDEEPWSIEELLKLEVE